MNDKKRTYTLDIQNFNINITNNLRGLSVVNEKVVWACGTDGAFVKTTDGGNNWNTGFVAGAHGLDFRSIKAFDESRAIVVSAGTPARIYKTSDGGESWLLTWESSDTAIFLDAVDFWDENRGLVMGDPVGNSIFILKTSDGGMSWNRIPAKNIPESNTLEGGFAASGTCLRLAGSKTAFIGTGGQEARVYRSSDEGIHWQLSNTPVLSGSPMKGIYSLAFKNINEGVAVGGEWNVEAPLRSKAYTMDGGQTWALAGGTDSYCSGSCWIKDDVFLACGQSGIDISTDGGRNWQKMSDEHFYGISFAVDGKTGFGSGPGGKIALIKLIKL